MLFKYLPGLFATVVILVGLILAGCSTVGTGATTQESSSSPAQTTINPAESGSTTSPNQGNVPAGGPRGGAEMRKMFARAAEILGITEDQLTGAFQEAQKSVFGDAPTPSGISGQQPEPPSGTSGQPSKPPSGPSGQQPPSHGQGPDQESMQKVYSKMSQILNIAADKISSAMDQARQELQTGTSR
jgi:hypothetical protein